MTSQPKYYYRLLDIHYDSFRQWLNLPEGFTVEGVQEYPEVLGLTVKVRCPEEPDYEIYPGNHITRAAAYQKLFAAEDGRHEIVIWWPELGQEEPLSPFDAPNPLEADGWAMATLTPLESKHRAIREASWKQ